MLRHSSPCPALDLPLPIARAEKKPCGSITAVPWARWPGPATSPSNTPVPTTAGAWGWRRCSPKDSAHVLRPRSRFSAPGSPRGFRLTPSLLIPDDRKMCPAHIQCWLCTWEQISLLLVFSTPYSPACCYSFPSPHIPRRSFWEMFCLERLCNSCASLKLLCTEL